MSTKSFSRDDFDETITLQVGGDVGGRELIIHRSVAAKNSTYILEQNDSSSISLPPEAGDCDTVLDFVQFCYTGTTTTGEVNTCDRDVLYKDYIRLYMCAEQLGCPDLLNYCVDKIIKVYEDCDSPPEASDVAGVWEKTATGCKLRDLLCDMWIASMTKEKLLACSSDLPHAFIVLLAAASMEGAKIEKPTSATRFRYHEKTEEDDEYEMIDVAEGQHDSETNSKQTVEAHGDQDDGWELIDA